MSAAPQIRLDKLLSNLGYGSRREIAMLAARGEITLDGKDLRDASQKIALTEDIPSRLYVQREALDPLPGLVIMLHKPLGMTCSHKEAGPLVYEVLPPRFRAREPQISTVGRLDKDTSGLLLMTDDGALLHRIISPKRHIKKRYEVTLARPVDADVAGLFASGELMLEGEDTPCLPAHLHIYSETRVALTITEGRYHQVRRMFAATGNHVTALHRSQIGALTLPETLPSGAWRILQADEIKSIFL